MKTDLKGSSPGSVMLVGAAGQLGQELILTAPPGLDLHQVSRPVLDLENPDSVEEIVAGRQPAWIINAAAYTAVDQAENEPEAAYAVNRDAVAVLARVALHRGARLLHISSDYIFNGRQGRPYTPNDEPDPLGVYGASKLAGELQIREILGPSACIIRSAWLYSSFRQNFVLTMLKLLTERDSLNVVADQVGTPTWARGLAQAIWTAIDRGLTGLHHWTDAGVASWYDFSVAIQEEALNLGLIERAIPIRPINTAEFPRPAARPPFSVLDKSATWEVLGWTPLHWRASLRLMLKDYKERKHV